MQFRNVSSDTRDVAYGLLRPQRVEPDALITVDDAAAESYECQPAIWKKVEAPAAPAAPAPAAQATPAPASAPAAPSA